MALDVEVESTPEGELIRLMFREAGELIRRLEGSSVVRLSIAAGGCRVELERGSPASAAALVPTPGTGAVTGATPAPAADNRTPVVAPLVGTFFRSPQPGAKPFVEVGDVVDQGQPVAIVEAMKIMNQIAAPQRGRVAEILLKDGDWVEFEQVLIYLEPIES